MPQAHSPPFAVADATPWTWEGDARAIEYEVRFYPSSKGVDDLAQGGDRTVTITAPELATYDDTDGARQTTEHTSTLTGAAPLLVVGGVWVLLGNGLGHPGLTFSAAQSTEPAGGTHYRIRVRW